MKFQVAGTDGPSQMGTVLGSKSSIKSPFICSIENTRLHTPKECFFTSIIETNEILDKTNNNSLLHQAFQFSFDHEIIRHDLLFPYEILDETNIEKELLNKGEKTKHILILNHIQQLQHIQDENKPCLVVIPHAKQLLQHPKECIKYITGIRNQLGYDTLLYAPAVGDITNLAMLSYLSFDCFDTMKAMNAARKHFLFFPHGLLPADTLTEKACICPMCSSLQKSPKEMSTDEIFHHNCFMLDSEVKSIQNAIQNQQLRSLVENRIIGHPQLISLLRTYETEGFSFLEKRTPITKKTTLYATTREAQIHPAIRRFQNRLRVRYISPESSPILVFLPCSKKKPYSFSQSHRRFRRTLLNVDNPNAIHEVIITSPLGIVPRELELLYPASSYDIPVTGKWYEDEQMMIRTLLLDYMQHHHYQDIIFHVPEHITSFIEDIVPNAIHTVKDGKPTSKASLQNLQNRLQILSKTIPRTKLNKHKYEQILSIASFQFGKNLAYALLKKTTVNGKYPYLRIHDENKRQVGMITKERGFISLTLEGGKRITERGDYTVHISDDFTLKGSLFAPAIYAADSNIRRGDEVGIIQQNNLIAVGVALMNGDEMKQRMYGEAVKVRHVSS